MAIFNLSNANFLDKWVNFSVHFSHLWNGIILSTLPRVVSNEYVNAKCFTQWNINSRHQINTSYYDDDDYHHHHHHIFTITHQALYTLGTRMEEWRKRPAWNFRAYSTTSSKWAIRWCDLPLKHSIHAKVAQSTVTNSNWPNWYVLL